MASDSGPQDMEKAGAEVLFGATVGEMERKDGGGGVGRGSEGVSAA